MQFAIGVEATATLLNQLMPPGTVMDFAGSAAPTGFLLCDGSAVSRSTFANLFTAIGTTWGVGNGTTTFNVPDLRGRTTVGVGSVGTNGQPTEALAATGGEAAHTLSAAESGVASHIHNAPASGGYLAGGLVGSGTGYTGAAAGSGANWAFNGTGDVTATAPASSGHNNMQPFAALNKIIAI